MFPTRAFGPLRQVVDELGTYVSKLEGVHLSCRGTTADDQGPQP